MITSETENTLPKDDFILTYNFTFNEVALLAKFFRKNQDKFPDGLESFDRTIQNTIYNELSLDQIRDFYEK